MATNFTLRFLRNHTSLKLILKGDLDGSSAHVLMNALKRNCDCFQNISVDTSGLKTIHPFGQDVLRNRLSDLKRDCAEILFTGEYGDLMRSLSEYG